MQHKITVHVCVDLITTTLCRLAASLMYTHIYQGLEGYFLDSGFEQNIWCGIWKNIMYPNQKPDFTAICTQELGFTKM